MVTDPAFTTVALVGDIMFESPLTNLTAGSTPSFGAVLANLRAADVVVGNLEMPLSRRGSRMRKHSNLRSDPERIDDLREMGVQAVSLANNHLMDYGPTALLDTLGACDSAGILHSGAGAHLDAAGAPAWLRARGHQIALVSVSCTLPPGSEATATEPGIAPIRIAMSFEADTNLLAEQPGTVPIVHTWTRKEDEEQVLARVRRLAQEAFVIVAIHWGVPGYWLSPYQGTLAAYQQPLGRALIDAGATIVLGHHSHSLHGVEVYRRRPIFYSVGNFLFEKPRPFMERESTVVKVQFGPAGVARVTLTPLSIDKRGLPTLATGSDADHVNRLLESLSEPFGTRFEREQNDLLVYLA